jgi:hypothetical protein
MPVQATYENERIVLSGGRFDRCVFRNCELVFDGNPPDMNDCRIEQCRHSFVGPANATLTYLSALCALDPHVAAQIVQRLGIPPQQQPPDVPSPESPTKH